LTVVFAIKVNFDEEISIEKDVERVIPILTPDF